MAFIMLTIIYFLLWTSFTVAEKEVFVRLHQNTESKECHLPTEIDFTINEHQPRSYHRHLTRNDDFNINIPVYSLTLDDDIPRYKTEYYQYQQDSAIYLDIQNGASVLIRCVNRINGSDWYWRMDGHVYIDSTNHRLEPVLENGEIRRHSEASDQHVYRLSPIEDRHSCHIESEETKPQTPLKHPRTSRRKRQTTTPIKVDVAIIVDNLAYRTWLTRQNNDDVKAVEDIRVYFTHVIAGVNLRFQSMKPDLDVSIIPSSVTIFKSDMPWIDGIAEIKDGTKQVDAVKVLKQLQNWLPGNFVNTYDHVMAFTGHDLFSSGNEKYTTGLANVGELCKTDGSSTSIVEDRGGFQSIVTASHELGHGMNGVHDGNGNACLATSRFIMSARADYPETPETILNPWKFSPCSVNQFQTFFNNILDTTGAMASCLKESLSSTNIPDITGKFAGQVYGPDEQCRHIHGAQSYVCRDRTFGDESEVCRKMFCSKTASGSGIEDCESIVPAQGTSCGNKKWCIQGECVQSDEAPTREGNCIYGDQDGVILDGKGCIDVRNTYNDYCYPDNPVFRDRCCETCERIKTNNSVCEYGDKVTGCEVQNCGRIGSRGLYDIDCCGTCKYTGETTTKPITTPTTTSEATTPPICADAPLVNSQTCTEFISAKGDKQCYQSSTETACCKTCSSKKRNNPDCLYGDRNEDCLVEHCGKPVSGGGLYDDNCCETCSPLTTTRATTPTSTDTTTKPPTTSPTDTPETSPRDTPTTSPTDTPTTSPTDTPTTSPTDTPTTSPTDMPTTSPTDTPTTSPTYTPTASPTDTPTTSRTDTPTTSPTYTPTASPTDTPTTSPTTLSVQDTTTERRCIDGSGFGGLSCPRYIDQRGKGMCYNQIINSGCCETCRSLIDTSLPGCPYGDKDEICLAIDFNNLSTCSDTIIDKCCKSCHDQVRPQAPVDCTDGSGIGTLTCPQHVEKHGIRSCYETQVNKTCCKTCYSYSDLKTTDCMYGDRTPACNNIKISDYSSCSDFTKTYCCSTCQLIEEINKNQTSTVPGVHLAGVHQWTVLVLIIFSYYYV